MKLNTGQGLKMLRVVRCNRAKPHDSLLIIFRGRSLPAMFFITKKTTTSEHYDGVCLDILRKST